MRNLATLSPVVRGVLAQLRAQIERELGEIGGLRVVLFGSYARGEATENSDVDVLIVLSTRSDSARDFVVHAAAALFAETGLLVNPIVFTAEDHARRLAGGHPLLTSIAAEGIAA